MSDSQSPDIVDMIASRVLKRRAATDLSFFTPSSDNFNPKPYFPHSSHSINHGKAITQTPAPREATTPPPPDKPMDVPLDDPDATFIRYPNSVFPNSHLYPDGLTFKVLADNPEFFLVPADFRTEDDPSSDKVIYPVALEPPRGWCPAKKKDVKEKGAGAFQGAEAPRLRCTFCRRGYSGVNAKSMWRRHVFEKHKVPMSNRRDGSGEGGRGSRSSKNKENKRASSSTSIDFNTQSFPNSKGASTELLPAPNGIGEPRLTRRRRTLPRDALSEASASEQPESEVVTPFQLLEPEFAPDDDATSSSTHSPQSSGLMLPPSSPLDEGTSRSSRRDFTMLPSSPISTPRFKFRMPWKFPSPSHPLHISHDELSLAVPIGGITGEGLESKYVLLQTSPFPCPPSPATTQLSSPITNASPFGSKFVTGRVIGWKKSKRKSGSKLPFLRDPSPRRPLYTGPLPVPVTDRVGFDSPDFLTNSEGPDRSLSSLGDPLESWVNLNSPRRASSTMTGFPVTPIRKSASGSTMDELQLVSPGKEDATPSSNLPSRVGLGFNFKFDLTASGNKHSRSEGGEDDNLDECGELLNPTTEQPYSGSQRRGDRSSGGSFPFPFPELDEAERSPSADVDSEDQLSIFEDFPPLKKRKTTH